MLENVAVAEPAKKDISTPANAIQTHATSILWRERRGLLSSIAPVCLMTVIVALAAAASSFIELKTNVRVTNLSLALYMFSTTIMTFWWESFSEPKGLRTIYGICFTLFLLFSRISAVSVNIVMLVVFWTPTKAAVSLVQAVGGSTIANICEPGHRGKAMGIYYLGPLAGPGLAPIIGGLLTELPGWRITLWLLSIFAGALLFMIILFLPETLDRRNTDDGPKTKTVRMYLIGPLMSLKYLRYSPTFIIIKTAVTGVTYAEAPYNFDYIKVELVDIATTIARKASRYDDEGRHRFLPEDRMKENVWIVYVFKLLVHLVVGCVAYSTPHRASIGKAIHNFMRNVFRMTVAMGTQPLILALGPGWFTVLFALLAMTQGAGVQGKMDKRINQGR
ncbi:MFS general substrate transporter [Colletotrichum falcatum]|nr:MFS general substrate transporter [Colletotrichum falcatum]